MAASLANRRIVVDRRQWFPGDGIEQLILEDFLRDRDHAFDQVTTIGIQEVLTAPGSPWQKGYASYCTSLG